ncbi:alkaline phosphatase [Roseateles sp. DAIF2]|uniref:alkaline phosphatase D family protein n=1 Tax=Roseateles sp. DAIF2 TaxID=2714952 RepID=UPI0018A2E67F|nr:alkaline phosphatase D family protein [Roseateles sp. DAIF2]QPF76073.1 alkaline phosphatase [Roseateles sp. DAIF2]
MNPFDLPRHLAERLPSRLQAQLPQRPLQLPIQLLHGLETVCGKLQQRLRWLEERSTPARAPQPAGTAEPTWVDDSRVCGLQIGEVGQHQALIWVRSPWPARLTLQWSGGADFDAAQELAMPDSLAAGDCISRLLLQDLPPGRLIHLRLQARRSDGGAGDWRHEGRFRTAPADSAALRFAWSADVCGQGWGINPERGGLPVFQTLRRRGLDFFVHCGDSIYADHPLAPELVDEAGRPWRNLVTRAKSRVAQSLEDFRGNYRYNWLDAGYAAFCAEVPQLVTWDDHEVVNNWSPGLALAADPRYTVGLGTLAATARRAFGEHMPLTPERAAPDAPLYRSLRYGPQLELFMLDMHSHRGPNDHNLQTEGADFLGPAQLAWLQRALAGSDALWKVVVAGMPLGLNVPDGLDAQGRIRWQGVANGDDGAPLGRERELAALLSFIKRERIHNIVWLCGDVHYTAAHFYDPEQAAFKDFLPFWEFVSGPLHAGSYGPLSADGTFGLQTLFSRASPLRGASPAAGYQFFGEVEIDTQGRMVVTLLDGDAQPLFRQELLPRRDDADAAA